jgi:hypothetical protein
MEKWISACDLPPRGPRRRHRAPLAALRPKMHSKSHFDMLYRWWLAALWLVVAACSGALAGMERDVHDAGTSYHCVVCSATTDSLVGWDVCVGCTFADGARREPAHLGPPTNLGPLCGDCGSKHGQQQCGEVVSVLEQATCDKKQCERAAQIFCDGCSKLLCKQCLDGVHSVGGVGDHPAHTTWLLPSVDADQAAVLGE